MGIKKFTANALRSVVTIVEDRMHDAQAKHFCGTCDRCPDKGLTRNPYIAVFFDHPGDGVPKILVGSRPVGHSRQLEVPKFYSPSPQKPL